MYFKQIALIPLKLRSRIEPILKSCQHQPDVSWDWLLYSFFQCFGGKHTTSVWDLTRVTIKQGPGSILNFSKFVPSTRCWFLFSYFLSITAYVGKCNYLHRNYVFYFKVTLIIAIAGIIILMEWKEWRKKGREGEKMAG